MEIGAPALYAPRLKEIRRWRHNEGRTRILSSRSDLLDKGLAYKIKKKKKTNNVWLFETVMVTKPIRALHAITQNYDLVFDVRDWQGRNREYCFIVDKSF